MPVGLPHGNPQNSVVVMKMKPFIVIYTEDFTLCKCMCVCMSECMSVCMYVSAQILCDWITAFLTKRTQAVRVGISLSPWRHTHGGVPQGTKLGITLFAIMINGLLGDWHSRLKYVDDTTVFEIMPRNSTSLLDFAVRDIHKYCMEHSMRLSPKTVWRWS